MSASETAEGYVVDIACVRKYPQSELLDRARRHPRDCGLMGHCVESGYALVSENALTLLDEHATPEVLAAVRKSGKENGIRLRAVREAANGEMRTRRVEELP